MVINATVSLFRSFIKGFMVALSTSALIAATSAPTTLFTNFPMVRDIILRERIDIVHCHQVRHASLQARPRLAVCTTRACRSANACAARAANLRAP